MAERKIINGGGIIFRVPLRKYALKNLNVYNITNFENFQYNEAPIGSTVELKVSNQEIQESGVNFEDITLEVVWYTNEGTDYGDDSVDSFNYTPDGTWHYYNYLSI